MRIYNYVRSGAALSLLVVTIGCGDDEAGTTGFTGFASNPSTPTMPTTPATASDPTSEGSDASGSDSSTNPVDPSTGVDPTTSTTVPPMTTTSMTSMTTMTTDPPMTTTTDPMTTDPSTTSTQTTDDSSSSTTTTTMMMTTDPPPKDPQPAQGLYSNCFPSEMCVGLVGQGGCFTLQDAMTMVAFDGFCTILCQSAANCVPEPNVPAVTQCLSFDGIQKACFLQCTGDADCPTGMTCEAVGAPLNDSFCW